MDRVGFEPTTSAHVHLSPVNRGWKKEACSNPTLSFFLCMVCSAVLCIIKRSFEEASQSSKKQGKYSRYWSCRLAKSEIEKCLASLQSFS